MNIPKGFKKYDENISLARIKLCDKITKALEKHGYKEITLSAVYPTSESFPYDNDFRFKLIDSEGDVLCLTEDAVTGLLNAAEGGLERLCAFTEVYRFKGTVKNDYRYAAILTGFAGVEAEAELISVGLSTLRELGIPCSKIVLGNTTVLQGLAEFFVNGKVDKTQINKILEGELITDADYALKKLFQDTVPGKGDISAIRVAAEKITNGTSVNGLRNLIELSQILGEYGLDDLVEFDLNIMGQDYDNGTVFVLFDEAGNPIISGGRHDLIRTDSILRAVSMRISPDAILAAYPSFLAAIPIANAVIGVADGIIALKSAYRLKNSLAENNLSAVALYRTDRDSTVAYAKAFGIESAVFVDGEGNIFYD